MAWYNWSQTSATNASADSSINWAEGQAPSSVNDSARAMMAATAKYRDDISGAIVTGGSSTAYTVASYSVFDTLAHMANQMIAFTPHATNGATVTLNVDGLGAKPLRSAPSAELLAGTLILGTPYVAVYNNTDAVWYLQGFYGNPYNVPLGSGMDYWLPTAPNSAFVFPFGQAISRTTYATLFAGMGTTYGSGDGSTTFNLPDKRDRVSAGKSNMGGTYASRLSTNYFGSDPGVLGAVGGSESHTLTRAQLPTGITSSGSNWNVVGSANASLQFLTANNNSSQFSANAGGQTWNAIALGATVATQGAVASGSVTSDNTSGTAHNNVQPTIVCNYIIRVL